MDDCIINMETCETRLNDSFKAYPEIFMILSGCFNFIDIEKASDTEDSEHATDIMIDGSIRIAVRTRKEIGTNGHNYLKDYGYQFTIRCKTEHNHMTELDKIMNGYGDYILYCFVDTKGKILKWTLGNLAAFRIYRKEYPNSGFYMDNKRYKDGTAGLAFNIADIPNFIIKQSEKK